MQSDKAIRYFSLNDELYRAFLAFCDQHGLDKSSVVEAAIQDYISSFGALGLLKEHDRRLKKRVGKA